MRHSLLPTELLQHTMTLMSKAHYAILQGSLSVKGQSEATDGYSARVAYLDRAILHVSHGKWLHGRATGELADFASRSYAADDLSAACLSFTKAIETMESLHQNCLHPNTLAALPDMGDALSKRGELLWFYDAPIVPSICPIVILSGSSVDMGRQYAQQCIEIFGQFIFEAFALKTFSKAETDHLKAWRGTISQFTPEIIDMASGIVDGAKQHGVALTQDQALSMWIGALAPAEIPAPIGVLDAEGGGIMGAYFGDTEGQLAPVDDIAEGLCSGAAAWGGATKDGQLYFSTTTDHDCTFQVTIIAYPDEGYPFIYTPFSVNGSVPGVGRFGMAGHPGFNTAGLSYIHHGGGGGCAENAENWGYGIPRGASTFHILRYAKSAKQAETIERGFPVGDVGHVLGTPGGFYADQHHGFIYESRDPQNSVVRYATEDRAGKQHPFLYATNNMVSEKISSPAFSATEGASWDLVQGWVSNQEDTGDGAGLMTRRLWSVSAASRNQYLYDCLMAYGGDIDLQKMVSIFERGPEIGAMSWEDAEHHMNSGGVLPHHSAAHRLNAFVAAGAPAERTYLASIGPITHRSVSPNRPGHGYFIHDETNAYWEVTLADEIADTLKIAKALAVELAHKAEQSLGEAKLSDQAKKKLLSFYDEIQNLLEADFPVSITAERTDEALAIASRCLRHYTRAQVRAKQILQSLNPPEEWRTSGTSTQ